MNCLSSPDLILISTPCSPCRQQFATSNTGPILVFPLIQPFGSDESSSLGKVYSRQSTESVNCENSAVSFVMKCCPDFHRSQESCISTKFCSICLVVITFQFVLLYLCNRISLCARSSSFKSMFVLITLGTNEELDCPSDNWLPRSIVKGFIFFTHFCDCSVKTELIYRSNCAKKSLNRLQIGTIVYRQFSTTFATFSPTPDSSPRNDHCPAPNLFANRETS